MASVAGTSLAAQAESESDAPSQPLPLYTWREFSPEAQLWYCKTISEANDAVNRIRSDSVGFDMEWKPVYVSGQAENRVALVQVADGDHIVLVQVSQMQLFPEPLRLLLEDPSVAKTGVGISGDAQKLYRDRGISMSNVVDLGLMARSTDNANWKGPYNSPIGLARLIALYEKRELRKGRISRSNWEKVPLSDEQKQYAANDAHCAWLLYARLRTLLSAMAKPPKPICYTFDAVRGRLCEPTTTAQWAPANPDYDPGPPPPKPEPYLWSKFSPNAQLKYCKSVSEANAAISAMTSPAVGFDIVFRKPNKNDELNDKHVALILLADQDWIVLIHIDRMNRAFPGKLRDLLQNDTVVKAGMSRNDITYLLQLEHSLWPYNLVDLSFMARSVDAARWKKGRFEDMITLRELVSAYDKHSLPKNADGFPKDLDWRLPLSKEVMLYAANSAHGRWRVYTKLDALLSKMKNPPPSDCYTYDLRFGMLCKRGTYSLSWVPHRPNSKGGRTSSKEEGKGKGKGRQGMPPSREAGRRPPSTAQGSSGGQPARKYKKEGFGGVPSTSPNPPAFVGPFLPDTLTAIEAARKVRERAPIPGLQAEPEKAPAPSQSGAPSTSGASAGPSKHR